jgi:hypothetical protein
MTAAEKGMLDDSYFLGVRVLQGRQSHRAVGEGDCCPVRTGRRMMISTSSVLRAFAGLRDGSAGRK